MSQLVTEMININLVFKASDFPISALVKWILSVSLNIHTLRLHSKFVELNGLHNEIVRLKKLKELEVSAYKASDLKEVTLIAFRITTTLLISS
jgi:hypothetical protein